MNAPTDLRDIPGFPGYAATADGRIWSHSRGCWLPASGKRYLMAWLRKDGGRAHTLVHRAVALAWVPNPDALPQVNHINGQRKDNRATNLEWCTQSANMRHAWGSGLQVFTPAMHAAVAANARASNKLKRALSRDQAIAIRARVEAGELQYRLADEYGVTKMVISNIVNGKTYADCR